MVASVRGRPHVMIANCWRQIEMLNEISQSFLLAFRWQKLQKWDYDAILICEIHERVEKSELTIFFPRTLLIHLSKSASNHHHLPSKITTQPHLPPFNPTATTHTHLHPLVTTCQLLPSPATTHPTGRHMPPPALASHHSETKKSQTHN
mgnify:CR=1 FL=1